MLLQRMLEMPLSQWKNLTLENIGRRIDFEISSQMSILISFTIPCLIYWTGGCGLKVTWLVKLCTIVGGNAEIITNRQITSTLFLVNIYITIIATINCCVHLKMYQWNGIFGNLTEYYSRKKTFSYSTGIVFIFHGQKGRWGIEVMHAIGKPTWVVLYCHWINHWEYRREKKIQQTCVLKQISVNNTMHTRREENIARIASAFPCHFLLRGHYHC